MTQPTAPNLAQMRRLALIRRLYEVGLDQSRTRGPTAALSLLSFHDALELMLQLACEHLDVRTKLREFQDYRMALEEKGVVLAGWPELARLNAARVNLKHRGLLPAAQEIEGLRAATTNLLDDCCEAVFGSRLGAVSVLSLIPDEAARSSLEAAEAALSEGDSQTALSETAVAFVRILGRHDGLIGDPTGKQRGYALASAALGNFTWSDPDRLAQDFQGNQQFRARTGFAAILTSANVLSEAITVVGYGLDFAAYLRFRARMPIVQQYADGRFETYWIGEPPEDPEVVRESIDFVTDTALRLTERAAE